MTDQTPETADTYNPADYTVDQVNEFLDAHPEQTGAVLDAEAEGKGRQGILQGPHATPADTTAQTVEDAGKAVPKAEGEKYEKGYDGFAPSRDGDNPEDLTLAGVLKRQNGEG